MARHRPAKRIRSCDLQLAAICRERVDVVYVLRKVVQRVPARRRSAHSQFERRRPGLGKRGLDLHPMMLGLGKRETIAKGLCGVSGGRFEAESREDKKEDPESHSSLPLRV